MELKEMFEPIINFIKGLQKKEKESSKEEAKKRLQLVLMQDRASVSPDFFEMMKKEIIEVIKKYIEIDEEALEVQLTRGFEGGLEGPALYANIPIKNIKPIAKKVEDKKEEENIQEDVNTIEKEKIEETKENVNDTEEVVEIPNEDKQVEDTKDEVLEKEEVETLEEAKVQEENIQEEKQEKVQEEKKKVENKKSQVKKGNTGSTKSKAKKNTSSKK